LMDADPGAPIGAMARVTVLADLRGFAELQIRSRTAAMFSSICCAFVKGRHVDGMPHSPGVPMRDPSDPAAILGLIAIRGARGT